MQTLNQHYHECLREQIENETWNGMCVFCNVKQFTELAHFISNTQTNKKYLGNIIIDMPILQTLPACRECNSGIHDGYQRKLRIPLHSAVVNAGREAFERWYNDVQRADILQAKKIQSSAMMCKGKL